jgi:hypothetical protein
VIKQPFAAMTSVVAHAIGAPYFKLAMIELLVSLIHDLKQI